MSKYWSKNSLNSLKRLKTAKKLLNWLRLVKVGIVARMVKDCLKWLKMIKIVAHCCSCWFLMLLSFLDGSWRFLGAFDGSWWFLVFLMIFCNSWWFFAFSMVLGGSWGLLMVLGGLCKFLAVHGGSWCCLMILGVPKAILWNNSFKNQDNKTTVCSQKNIPVMFWGIKCYKCAQ